MREYQILCIITLSPTRIRYYYFNPLLNDDICAIPEFNSVALRMGKKIPPVVIGNLYNDPDAEREIEGFCSIAHVLHDLKRARIGQMGHVLEAMLDMHTDPTLLTSAFGCHIVQTEPEDIFRHYLKVDESEIGVQKRKIISFFDTPDPGSDPITRKLTEADLHEAAKVSVALEHFINEKNWMGLPIIMNPLKVRTSGSSILFMTIMIRIYYLIKIR